MTLGEALKAALDLQSEGRWPRTVVLEESSQVVLDASGDFVAVRRCVVGVRDGSVMRVQCEAMTWEGALRWNGKVI